MGQSFEEIGKRLIQLREALGYSQVEFCRRAGIANNNYNPFEQGKRRITLDAADKLKKTFGVSRDWIYDGEVHALRHELFELIYNKAGQRSMLKAPPTEPSLLNLLVERAAPQQPARTLRSRAARRAAQPPALARKA